MDDIAPSSAHAAVCSATAAASSAVEAARASPALQEAIQRELAGLHRPRPIGSRGAAHLWLRISGIFALLSIAFGLIAAYYRQ